MCVYIASHAAAYIDHQCVIKVLVTDSIIMLGWQELFPQIAVKNAA